MSALNELTRDIEALAANGAAHYDPVRFRFITAMAHRAEQHGDAVAGLVIIKAQSALQALQQDLAQAHIKAIKHVQFINKHYPEKSPIAQHYLAASDYRPLAKLIQRLQLKPAVITGLSVLTAEILQGEQEPGRENKPETLEDVLRQQESELMQSLGKDSTWFGGVAVPAAGQLGELKSVRLFRESWSKIHSEQRLTQSINDAPESAGPLNEQKLMIRSLEMMQELSPKYLSRFVGYIDSLLWLEQAAKKTVFKKAKKKKRNALVKSGLT